MKELQGFHVVFTLHNSPTSKRMVANGVKTGDSKLLCLPEEILLTTIISDVIIENKFKCIAYNICQDHVHIILVCEANDLTSIVKTIKGKSSFLCLAAGIKLKGEPLWSQKFFRANLDVWTLSTVSNSPGEIFNSSYLENAINYIINNRNKHKLPESIELQHAISKFIITTKEAYEIEDL